MKMQKTKCKKYLIKNYTKVIKFAILIFFIINVILNLINLINFTILFYFIVNYIGEKNNFLNLKNYQITIGILYFKNELIRKLYNSAKCENSAKQKPKRIGVLNK